MTNEIKKIEEKNITDVVFNRVVTMQLNNAVDLPKNYSVGNALKSAYLILKDMKVKGQPVLQVCTQESVTTSLLDMVVQGLNPMKHQCYFIPYGNQLQLSRSYLGDIALTKRLKEVKDVVGYAVYSTDKFELGFDIFTGKTIVKEYVPSTNRKPEDLIGALGLITGEKGILYTEYMDIEQIKTAWNQGSMKGNSGAHKNFPDQMAIKTVIRRTCKRYANTCDDGDKIADLINKSMEDTDFELQEEIQENANIKELPTEFEEIPLEEIEGQIDIQDVLNEHEEKRKPNF